MKQLLGALVLITLFVYLPLALLTPIVGWYRPGQPVFSDSTVGTVPEVSYYREIVVDSFISYSVIVRNSEDEIMCDAVGGPFQYKAQVGMLSGKTLVDWAPSDPRCTHLPVGEYVVETTWTVTRPLGDYLPEGFLRDVFGGILPPKYVTRVSPVFHILPLEETDNEG